jgi:hypothetical protein
MGSRIKSPFPRQKGSDKFDSWVPDIYLKLIEGKENDNYS